MNSRALRRGGFIAVWGVLALIGSASAGDMMRGVAAAMPAVVSVLPDWPKGLRARVQEPEGSGVALGRGLVAIADHVLGPAKTVRVRSATGDVVPAQIVLRDSQTDIAVLRVDLSMPTIQFAGDPVPGQPVCAIGNAFGLGLSVTCGVVSAVHRAGVGFNAIEDFVQTDASVNPGASGGALIDEEGRLVGMLSAIFTKGTDADIGVNFAVSTALLNSVVEQSAAGRARHVSLGVRLAAEPSSGEVGPSGLRVESLEANSFAARAGLQAGDLLRTLDGRSLTSVEGLRGLLARGSDEVVLGFDRNNEAQKVRLQLREAQRK